MYLSEWIPILNKDKLATGGKYLTNKKKEKIQTDRHKTNRPIDNQTTEKYINSQTNRQTLVQ